MKTHLYIRTFYFNGVCLGVLGFFSIELFIVTLPISKSIGWDFSKARHKKKIKISDKILFFYRDHLHHNMC